MGDTTKVAAVAVGVVTWRWTFWWNFSITYSNIQIGPCHAPVQMLIPRLKKWHGWLASSSFRVAMMLAPDRKKFTEVIGGSGDVNADIEKFCTTFAPFLQENHKFLASVGLDNLKAS